MPDTQLTLSVEPQRGPLWLRRSITITGATPGSVVTVRATTTRLGTDWSAQASFLADGDGTVHLDSEAPVSGDYRTADSMGLFWVQRPTSPPLGPPGTDDVRDPIVTELEAWNEPGTGYLDEESGGAERVTATAQVEQWLLSGSTRRSEVRDNGLVGTLFTPEGPGPFPTVIVLNGSGGGINEVRAAQYASRGIQAFALGYFRAEGLPRFISRTPLEYFRTGIDYVIEQCAPLGGLPVVSGQSRGGELTLLLAATYPDKIAGIAAFVPGAFVFGAQGAADPAEGWNGPSWTLDGQPLEHLWNDNSGVSWQPWDGAPPPSPHADIYIDGLHDRALARATRIPIERFRGHVACVSGLDDRAWPSSMASRMVMNTLERHGHGATRLHLDYEAAGHGIGVPFLPATSIQVLHPVSKTMYSNGGTPAGNAHASEDSFEQICAFIRIATGAEN